MGKVTQSLEIPSYMVDELRRLRAASFFELSQQIAIPGAARFSDEKLAERDGVWILARMQARFRRLPVRDDKVTLSTWHKGVKGGLFFVRDYEMLSGQGEVLVQSTSSWIVMSRTRRKAMRPSSFADIIPSEPQYPDNAIEDLAPKVAAPHSSEWQKKGEHRVAYSDVDYNHHANNTKYIAWAMDLLPEELTIGSDIAEVSINYTKEARMGELVELYHTSDGTSHFVEGRVGAQQIFICSLTFSQA